MPGAKLIVFIFTFFFFGGTSLNSVVLAQAADYTKIASNSPWIQVEEKDIALKAMLASFGHLSSFLNDVQVKQDCLLSQHGETREEAINFLSLTFSYDLAKAIIDEYTWFKPDFKCLAIKPGEGLPILTQEDLPYINWQLKTKDCIIFSRYFRDCYSLGDIYCYQVEMMLYENQWKISSLSLLKLD